MRISRIHLFELFVFIAVMTAEILNMRTLSPSEQIAHVNYILSIINPIANFGVNVFFPIAFVVILIFLFRPDFIWQQHVKKEWGLWEKAWENKKNLPSAEISKEQIDKLVQSLASESGSMQ